MCIAAFQHTTGVIGLDACHIKASYGGVLLVMTVLDGNGNVFPAALGIAESENTSSWTWFLTLVKTPFRIEDGSGVVFLSDREKGIDAAVSGVFPRAKHSYCAYHIEKNLKRNHHTRLKGLVFKAAKATTARGFEETLHEMKTLNAEAGNYIEGIEKERWARAFFPAPRFGHVTSNISESMNHWLEEARHKDPVALFSTYIRHLNQLFETRREEYQSINQTDLPKQSQKSSTSRLVTRGSCWFSGIPTPCLRSREK